MHGIAATKLTNRIDIFWTDENFGMTQRTWDGTQWHGWFQLGGLSVAGQSVPKMQFRSVPAAVASMARPPMVVQGSPGIGNPGGPVVHASSEPAGTSHGGASLHAAGGHQIDVTGALLAPRIDVFGLGTDYAMYTKTLWRMPHDNPDPWFNLGGIFTSAPAAIVWQNGRIDVFGLGLDHALFQKTWNGSAWSNDWARLGGTFSSAASVVSWGPKRLDVFVRGVDFTLRHRTFDGSVWTSDWQNLGGTLASEPVAVSWGPDRLDIFAIFRDGALWHKWWDGQIWNEWESLGGSSPTGGTFIGSPSAVSWSKDRLDAFAVGSDGHVYHFSWSGEAWAGPEFFNSPPMTSGPTAISTAPNKLDVFAPGDNLNPQPDAPPQYVLYHKAFNGAAWQPANWFEALGGRIRLPSRYRFSVDYVTADTTRSLNTDTDTASASIAAGNWPTQTKTQGMGDVGGTHPSQAQLNLLHFDPVTVELCEASSFNYLVVNNGHADQKSLNDALVKAAGSLADDSVKSVATELGAGVGAIVSVELAGSIVAPVIGSLLGSVVGWLMDQLGSVVFQNCDGLVAAELIVLFGRDLDMRTAHGPYSVKTVHPGTDSGTGCGDNSKYEVTWSISRI